MDVRMHSQPSDKQAAIGRFVPVAMNYLDQALGGNTAFYGSAAVVDTIRYGVERAERYGIIGQNDVCLYLRLMFSLMGSDFDEDPLYPWATEILQHTHLPPNDKVMRLTGRANQVMKEIQRQEPYYFKSVLGCTRNNLFASVPDEASAPRIAARVLAELKHRLPGKVAVVGEANVTRLIALSMEDARAHGLQRGSDVAAFVQFAFINGVHFYADPRFPQARAIFSDARAEGPARVKAMFAEARKLLLRKLHLLRA